MTTTTTNIKNLIAELKEYEAIKQELAKEVDRLKDEIIEYLKAEDTDEYTCDEGKVTYREVISKRFATTEFKKIHKDLYEAFTKQTTNMRFTCN